MADDDTRSVSERRAESVALLTLGALLGVSCALHAGFDADFDLKNYHWYDAWAVLHGRAALDVAPAQLQSYFHPLLDLLFYGAVTVFSPAGGSALLGALHGLVPGLAGLLARRLLPGTGGRVAAVATVLAAAYAPVFLAEVGTSKGDLPVAALILGGLLCLLTPTPSPRSLLLSGLLTGIAVGCKWTAAPFAFGLLALLAPRGRATLRRAGVGLVLGVTLVGGPWALWLWAEFDNPVFPMANHLFRSPFAADLHFAEMGYFPQGIDWILLPLRFAQGGEVSWFYAWRDARWLVLTLLGIAVLLLRRRAPAAKPLPALFRWAAASYLLWLFGSSMIRYLAPLEAAAPALLFAALHHLLGPRRGLAAGLCTLLLLALWLRPTADERTPFAATPFSVELPPLPPGPRPVVVTAGEAPLSYLAPSFPPQVRHLRVSSSVVWHEDDTELNRRIRRILADAEPILLLSGPGGVFMEEALASYGLAGPPRACRPVASALDDGLLLCLAARLPPVP